MGPVVTFVAGDLDDDDENEDRREDDGIGDVIDAVGVWVLVSRNEGRSLPVRDMDEGLEDSLGVGGLEDTGVWVFEPAAVGD